MSIREAIEAMKIVAPHSHGLYLERTNLEVIRQVIRRVGETPTELVRLLALMEHRSLEAVVEEYSDRPERGFLLVRLTQGFGRNPLDLLVNSAYHLGLVAKGWQDG